MSVGFAEPPPDPWRIGEREVHLWLAHLDCAADEQARYWELLSSDERERAKRFRFERDQKRFAAGRGILRQLLGKYVGKAPKDVAFHYGEHGKPAIESELKFNLAHAAELAVFGITRGREIGVDIERIRPNFATMDIAKRFFSAREYEMLMSAPEDVRCEAFFNCWTRKEAFIKAKGMGLFLGLHTFAVSLLPEQEPALLQVNGHAGGSERWTILALETPGGFVGAAAVERKELDTKGWQWKPGP